MKIACIASTVSAALFVLFGGMHFGFDLRTVALLSVVGVMVGVMAAPEFERKPTFSWVVGIWQASAGVLGGVCVALLFVASAESAGIGAMIGGAIGLLAPVWIRRVQLP